MTSTSLKQVSVSVKQETHRQVLKSYLDWRMLKILLLGLISGFPWILIASMMSLWLQSEGLSRSGIGFFGVVFTVYAFNMFWAPLVDAVRLPLLYKLGQRRSWILLMQSCIAVLIIGMARTDPGEQLILMSLLAFLIALASATQDVAVDALRIELISKEEPEKVGAASAMATSGWWLGFGGMGAVGLFLAEYLEQSRGVENYWQVTYLLMVPVVIVATVLLLVFVKEPGGEGRVHEQQQDIGAIRTLLMSASHNPLTIVSSRASLAVITVAAALLSLFLFQYLGESLLIKQYLPVAVEGTEATSNWATNGFIQFVFLWAQFAVCITAGLLVLLAISSFAVAQGGIATNAVARIYSIWYMPVLSFVRNYGVRIGILLISLVFLFKVGEAFLGRMSIIFYKEVGFSKGDIALYSKGFGTLALCAFAIISSLINARYGLFRGLLIGGIAMSSTNLLFAWLAFAPEKWLFALAVVSDQFTTAMSTVALVAFLSQLCDRAYTATQYAALASLGNLSRTTLAVGSGVLVDSLGGNWSLFFVITTLMVLPSLALLLYIRFDIRKILAGSSTKLI